MRTTPLRTVVVLLCAAMAGAGLLAGKQISDDNDGRTVVARFASAAPLVDGNQVKLDGVTVGEVLDMHADGRYANVLLQLDEEALPLHRDATFTIRPISLLGERYVDLERGSHDEPMLPLREPVPVSQTGSNVDLDEVLNAVDKPTGRSLAFLLTTLGEGMRGNGDQARAALAELPNATGQVRQMTRVLRQHNALLDVVVQRTQPVADALATEDGRALNRLVDGAQRLLGATRSRDRELDTTLRKLPGTLRAARGTLDQLGGTARQTTPTLAQMRPVTDDLRGVSGELHRFAGSLDPALAAARPVLQRAERLLERAGPVAASLRRLSPGVRRSAAHAQPLVERLSADMDNVFNYIRNWALTTNGHDGLSHYLRVNLIVNPATFTGGIPRQMRGDSPRNSVQPPRLQRRLPHSPSTPSVPGAPGTPLPEPGQVPAPAKPGPSGPTLLRPDLNRGDRPDGRKPRTRRHRDGVTGLSYAQETRLVSFLLGGEA